MLPFLKKPAPALPLIEERNEKGERTELRTDVPDHMQMATELMQAFKAKDLGAIKAMLTRILGPK